MLFGVGCVESGAPPDEMVCSGGVAPVPRQLGRESETFEYVALSPDSRHVAFVSDRDGALRLWVMAAAASKTAEGKMESRCGGADSATGVPGFAGLVP